MTIAHALCGYLAIALLVQRWHDHGGGRGVTIGDLRIAAALVSAGAVLDVLDGPVARRQGSSGLGDLLDAMCDTVTFGVVPGVIVAASGTSRTEVGRWALILAGGVFLTAMILRLVRSEVNKAEVLGHGFQGLPSAPAAGVTLAIVAVDAAPWLTCLLVAVTAWLVVGDYHYPRQRPALMPIIAGGPAIGLLGLFGVLPLVPAAIVMMASTLVLPAASAASAWRRRRQRSYATGTG